MVKKQSVGIASIGVGGFFLAIGILCIALTVLNVLPNQSWIVSWITNYVVGSVGIIIGLLLLGYGIYTRRVLGGYVRKIETLTEAKAEQAQELRRRKIALKKTEAELSKKQKTLQLTKGQLRASRRRAKQMTKQVYRVSGKLGDRTKRLKKIEKIVKVKKKQ